VRSLRPQCTLGPGRAWRCAIRGPHAARRVRARIRMLHRQSRPRSPLVGPEKSMRTRVRMDRLMRGWSSPAGRQARLEAKSRATLSCHIRATSAQQRPLREGIAHDRKDHLTCTFAQGCWSRVRFSSFICQGEGPRVRSSSSAPCMQVRGPFGGLSPFLGVWVAHGCPWCCPWVVIILEGAPSAPSPGARKGPPS